MIQDELETIEIGLPITVGNLTMFPLLRGNGAQPPYAMLDEALAAGTARVTEVSDVGTVPELRFLNDGDAPVLLLDGEELVGAKQNRVLNLTILAPARAAITIPVSCVEAGRWSRRSATFSSASRTLYARARGANSDQVSSDMMRAGARRSDQGALWDDIAAKAERLSVASPTGAMADIYARSEAGVEAAAARLLPVDGQAGAMFGIDGAIAGIDLFDSPATLAKALPKLVRGYALDAVETAAAGERRTERGEARRFLGLLAETRFKAFPAVGLGEDWRIESRMVAGGALVVDGETVHLWAFPLIAANGRPA